MSILVSGLGLIWFLPLLFFSVRRILHLVGWGSLQTWYELMRNSEKTGFPTFAALDKREASLEEFALEVYGWLPVLPVVSLPGLTGEMLSDVVRRKSGTAGSLDGWGWRELKVLPVAWFDGLARILSKVLYLPWCRYLAAQGGVEHQLYADNLK